MALCHGQSIKILQAFLDDLPHFDGERALEAAAGDGRVTKDLLVKRFDNVDCFDQCPKAVKLLEKLRAKYVEVDLVDQARMQSHAWQREYTCILLRWCVGYLNDLDLVAFLKESAKHLKPRKRRSLRYDGPCNFIVVLDNVHHEGGKVIWRQGQRTRHQSHRCRCRSRNRPSWPH